MKHTDPKYLVFILVYLVTLSAANAQRWERLPFNGGPLDGMAQNPYDENEIVGYVRLGEMFRSTDGGRTWNLIEQDSVLWRESYLDITFDRQGRIYVLNVWGLWRSEDHAETWNRIDVPKVERFGGFGCRIQVTENGTLFVYNGSVPKLLRSENDGVTWSEVPVNVIGYVPALYIDSYDPDVIVIHTVNTTFHTIDGGITWVGAARPTQHVRASLVQRVNDNLVFHIIGGSPANLYKSLDTCRTWRKVSVQDLPFPYSCEQRGIRMSLFNLEDSVLVARYCDMIVRSTDGGQTFHSLFESQNEYELLQVGDRLIASVSMDGVVESDDYGNSWHHVESSPQTLNYEEIEFAVAQKDTMFALVADAKRQIKDINNNFRYRAERLFMSVDDGHTWKAQFKSRSNHGLTVDAGTPARYYMLVCESSDRFSLITGVAGQSVPDTIYTYKPGTHPWQNWDVRPSQKYPGYLYATKYDATIGWSSDRGENWNWSTWPLYVTGMHPWPLQLDPAKMMVTAWQDHWLYDEDEGIYISTDRAQKLFWTYRGPLSYPLSERLYAGYDDRLFKPSTPELSSTDDGATWDSLETGLDPGTKGMRLFQSHEEVLLHTNTGIYQYENRMWAKIRYRDGTSVHDPSIYARAQAHEGISVEKYGDNLYIMIPKDGLYYTNLQNITDIDELPGMRSGANDYEIFPNPVLKYLVIDIDNIKEYARGIRIYNVLGDLAWAQDIHGSGSRIVWDCENNEGVPVKPGVYLIRIITDKRNVVKKVLVGPSRFRSR